MGNLNCTTCDTDFDIMLEKQSVSYKDIDIISYT